MATQLFQNDQLLAMAYCPHCNRRYDEDNETQPCCGTCGHPISCGCGGGHQSTRSSPSVPPSVRDALEEEFGDDETDGNDNEADRPDDGDDDPDENRDDEWSQHLPF